MPKIGVLEQERLRKAAHAAANEPDPAAVSAAEHARRSKVETTPGRIPPLRRTFPRFRPWM